MKYELTTNFIKYKNKKLYQIKALKNFGYVKVGDLGGYIEKESNLSQEGNCWAFDNAKVYDEAKVWGNAEVWGKAEVYGNALVGGDAKVYDEAKIYGDAKVWGKAEVYGNAQVYGNAEVFGEAKVFYYAEVYGNAQVYGNALVGGDEMEDDEIGTFIEKTYNNGRKEFRLQTRATMPCTEEEKRIYGVDVKLDESAKINEIISFEGEVFYRLSTGWSTVKQCYFKNLDTAKKYLIEEAKKQKLL